MNAWGKFSSGIATFVGASILLGVVVTAMGPKDAGKTVVTAQADPAELAAATGAAELRNMSRNPERFQLQLAYLMPHGWACYVFRGENGFWGMDRDIAVSDGRRVMAGTAASTAWETHCASPSGRRIVTPQVRLLLERIPPQ
jgi:hypothetical protein